MQIPSVDFFGLKISVFTKDELINSIVETIKTKESKIYYGYSLAVLLYIKKYPNYYSTTSNFDVMVTDGRVFYLLAKFFKFKLRYDISIPRLTILTLEVANENGFKLMIVGGTKESNLLACNNISENYPRIDLCNGLDGFFPIDQERTIQNTIYHNNPDILLLGLPTPRKQVFASKIKPKLSGCIIIPCGGMIDVLAGKEKLTPIWLKKYGLASIYRHVQNPSRIPETLQIYSLSFRIVLKCLYLKYIKRTININIPYLIQHK